MVEIKGLEKLAPRDFPGFLSATIFTGGCNFRCPFCHNADLVLRPESLAQVPHEEFFRFLETRRGFLEAVCITGGEPLVHKNLGDLLAAIKDKGLLVKLDTNGSFPRRLEDMLRGDLVDAVAMDVKAPPERYAEVVGAAVDPQDILESMRIIRRSGLRYTFRTTVIPGFVDTPDIEAIARGMLEKDDPYVLQPFHPGNTLDAKFSEHPSCSTERLRESADAVRGRVPLVRFEGETP